jgi:hypothetical protein
MALPGRLHWLVLSFPHFSGQTGFVLRRDIKIVGLSLGHLQLWQAVLG